MCGPLVEETNDEIAVDDLEVVQETEIPNPSTTSVTEEVAA